MNFGVLGNMRNRIVSTYSWLKGAIQRQRKPQAAVRKAAPRGDSRIFPKPVIWRAESLEPPPSPIGHVHWPESFVEDSKPVAEPKCIDVHWSSKQSDNLISTVTGASPSPHPRVPLPCRIILLRHGEPQPQPSAASDRLPEWKVPLTNRGTAQVWTLSAAYFNIYHSVSLCMYVCMYVRAYVRVAQAYIYIIYTQAKRAGLELARLLGGGRVHVYHSPYVRAVEARRRRRDEER